MSVVRLYGKLTLIFITMLFIGCAGTGPKFEEVENFIPQQNSEEGRIFFYRTSSIWGAGMRPAIYIDNVSIGSSSPGTIFYADVAPGRKVIKIPSIMYGGERKIEADIKKGSVLYVKTWIGASGLGGRTNMEIVEPERALNEIGGLALKNGPASMYERMKNKKPEPE